MGWSGEEWVQGGENTNLTPLTANLNIQQQHLSHTFSSSFHHLTHILVRCATQRGGPLEVARPQSLAYAAGLRKKYEEKEEKEEK